MKAPVAIMSAMHEEIDKLVAELERRRTTRAGMRDYHRGMLWGAPCVLVFSRWGKVAAASTATHLIGEHRARALVFTGVAGGIRPGLKPGDIVVGRRLVQHDMDARPIFERHEIPLLGQTELAADARISTRLARAARSLAASGLPARVGGEFGVRRAKVIEGEIASGDRFFASAGAVGELRRRLPRVVCVEMEGAAVAQVCHEHGVPFGIVRTISDSGDEGAPIDFTRFVRSVASTYSLEILRRAWPISPRHASGAAPRSTRTT